MSATARFQLTRANAPQANWNTATAVNTCAGAGMLGMRADGRRVDRAGAEGGNCGNEKGPQTMMVSRTPVGAPVLDPADPRRRFGWTSSDTSCH